jgi:syntaxin-binding protein 1
LLLSFYIAVKFPGWKVLVVDEHSMRVVSAAVGMYDIMERKITLVESLEKKRAPFPDLGAVYLLNPVTSSIVKLLEDFSAGKSLYGNGVFLYFLGRLPDNLLNEIKTCRPLMKRLMALTEINVDFLAKEERSFTLDMRDSFSSFYLRKGNTPIEVSIAEKLVTVCATLNEYPHIRYRQSSGICTSLASVFHLKMDEFVSQNPSWWYHGGPGKKQTAQKERGTLLLLDRADDCLSPLMHDFTYQSMVHDLLPMDGDRITFQSETNDSTKTEAKDVLLDERDPLWVELRGKHIAQVIETLSTRIREIMSSSTGSSLGGKKSGQGGNMSLSQMASALKALPEYREVMSKLSQHMHISHECMDVFKNEGLLDLSDLEQTLATGKDDDGRSPKMADMIDRVEEAMMRMKDPKKRLRLILITTISQGGLRTQDRRRLMNAAELSRTDAQTLNSLEVMGLAVFASPEERNKMMAMLTG